VSGAAAEIISIALLLVTLLAAVIRPYSLSEAVLALPAAILIVVLGIVPWHDASETLRELGPTVGFLAAMLVFGHLCAQAGVFDYFGSMAATASQGRPRRLLLLIIVLAAGVTVVLTLDATVVLLTPVVLAVTARTSMPPRPHALACARVANSASLLLPVSNLTNLLAFSASGLSFARFTGLMLAPWLVVVAGEWVGLRAYFADDLPRAAAASGQHVADAPRYALGVLAATVAAIVLCSSLHVAVAWAALGGCVLLLIPHLARRDLTPVDIAREASPGFCLFVFALGIIVDGVLDHGLHHALTDLVPDGTALVSLFAITFLAAALANVVNNLPATLVLVPIAATAAGPVGVLAVLLGVNVGPNASYQGSLATLLWRRLTPADARPTARQFHILGLLSVPLLLAACTLALWGAWQVVG
jgi:arsenical pump membrane protein